MPGSGRDYRGPVMLCEVLVRRIDIWLISVGMGNTCFKVVRDQDLGDAPKELKRMDMGFDPGR
jgi:hypothetical protein